MNARVRSIEEIPYYGTPSNRTSKVRNRQPRPGISLLSLITVQKPNALACSARQAALQAAEKLMRAVGPGFIPDINFAESTGPLGPEVCFSDVSSQVQLFSSACSSRIHLSPFFTSRNPLRSPQDQQEHSPIRSHHADSWRKVPRLRFDRRCRSRPQEGLPAHHRSELRRQGEGVLDWKSAP